MQSKDSYILRDYITTNLPMQNCNWENKRS